MHDSFKLPKLEDSKSHVLRHKLCGPSTPFDHVVGAITEINEETLNYSNNCRKVNFSPSAWLFEGSPSYFTDVPVGKPTDAVSSPSPEKQDAQEQNINKARVPSMITPLACARYFFGLGGNEEGRGDD